MSRLITRDIPNTIKGLWTRGEDKGVADDGMLDDDANPSGPGDKTDRETIEHIDALWREALSAMDFMIDGRSLAEIKDDGGRRYLGDHWDTSPREGMVHSVLNRTQEAVNTTVAVQTEQPLRTLIEPNETSDPPVYFITKRGIQKVAMAIAEGSLELRGAAEAFDPTEASPDEPLDELVGEALFELTKPIYDPMTGESTDPPLEADRDIIAVTDKLTAESLQMVHDKKMKEANADFYTVELETNSTIFGDQAILVEWDDDYDRFRFHCPHWRNVGIDPKARWIDDARYILLRETMPLDEAIRQWPQWERELRSSTEDITEDDSGRHAATTYGTTARKEGGDPDWGGGITSGEPYAHLESEREFVTITTAWLRGHRYPMDVDRALSRGIVEQKVGPVEVEMFGDGMMPEGESQFETIEQPLEGQYILVETGDDTDPEADNWPTRPGICQVKALMDIDRIIDKRECPYADIPLVWTKARPIPYQPYGLGVPFRLEDLQQSINRIITAIENLARYAIYPQEFLPEEVYQAIQKNGGKFRVGPGRQIRVPMDLFQAMQKGGRITFADHPPEVPEAWVNMLQLLLNQFDKLSGDVEVLRGTPPSSDTSGKALENLTGAASRTIAHDAKTLEWAYEHIAKIVLDAIAKWLPDEQWERYLSRYGGAVQAALKSKAKELRYDVTVEAVAGRQAVRRMEAAEADAMDDRGKLSTETYLEMHDFPNPAEEKRKILKEQREAQAAAQPQQMVMPQQPATQSPVQPAV